MEIWRIDCYILQVLEAGNCITMANSLLVSEIVDRIKMTYKLNNKKSLSHTVAARVNLLFNEGYIAEGVYQYKHKPNNPDRLYKTYRTWFITYDGIKLLKDLEEESNEVVCNQ